jgi:hypothetical protein
LLDREARILGVEGSRVEDGQIEPEMSATGDFSELEDAADSVHETREFIRNIATPDLAFDFTFVES